MKAIVIAALLLGGCTTVATGSEGQTPVGAPEDGGCDAGTVKTLAGKAFSAEIEAEALRLSGARVLRVLRPGDVATMDYRTDRLNLKLDAQDRLVEANCG